MQFFPKNPYKWRVLSITKDKEKIIMTTEINTNRNIPRMRTVHEAAQEMKRLDANTAVTEYHIRRLVLDGVLPKIKAGKKYLINLDSLLDYLSGREG